MFRTHFERATRRFNVPECTAIYVQRAMYMEVVIIWGNHGAMHLALKLEIDAASSYTKRINMWSVMLLLGSYASTINFILLMSYMWTHCNDWRLGIIINMRKQHELCGTKINIVHKSSLVWLFLFPCIHFVDVFYYFLLLFMYQRKNRNYCCLLRRKVMHSTEKSFQFYG